MPNDFWIDAYWNPEESVQLYNSCMTIADLECNSEHKLICVDFHSSQPRLKVYKGCSLSAETGLPDVPCAVTTIYTGNNTGGNAIPAIAVACGSQVLLYRNVRPYFKFTLPLMDAEKEDVNALERDSWMQKTDAEGLAKVLEELAAEHGFAYLSTQSQNFLCAPKDGREDFLKEESKLDFKVQMVICNMAKMPKLVEDEKCVECLIVSTESAHLFILDPESFTISEQFKIPSATIHMLAKGIYAVDYTILLFGRDGDVYKIVRGSKDVNRLLSLSSLPASVVLDTTRFLVASMDDTLQSYTLGGLKEWTLTLKGNPIGLFRFPPYISECTYAVACNFQRPEGPLEGFAYVYKGTELMYSLHLDAPIRAFILGPYSLGEQGFIFNTKGGGLSIKLLKRLADFKNPDKCSYLTNNLHQDVKLAVPKKSKIYMEQVMRERENEKEMYRWFQKSWLGMKVLTSELYLKALQKSTISNDDVLKLTAQVMGLGPRLKLSVQLENLKEEDAIMDVFITFAYDTSIYSVEKPVIPIPMMVPKFEYRLETFVTCNSNISGPIQIIISNAKVILTSTIQMPPAMTDIV